MLLENALKAYLRDAVFLLRLNLIFSIIFFLIGIILIIYGSYIIYIIPRSRYGILPPTPQNCGSGPAPNVNSNPNPNGLG